jgi:hypothetical protein
MGNGIMCVFLGKAPVHGTSRVAVLRLRWVMCESVVQLWKGGRSLRHTVLVCCGLGCMKPCADTAEVERAQTC